jgi:DNA-binding transcriptional regulator YdaS (Cro superfamily)
MNLRTYLDQSSRGMSTALARALCVTPVLISQWATNKRQVPAERCLTIEKATGGAVTCEEMRPDVDWEYLRGTSKIPLPGGAGSEKVGAAVESNGDA